jgi:hypothetical protein
LDCSGVISLGPKIRALKKKMLSFPQLHSNTLAAFGPDEFQTSFKGQSVGGLFVKPTGEPRTKRRWSGEGQGRYLESNGAAYEA